MKQKTVCKNLYPFLSYGSLKGGLSPPKIFWMSARTLSLVSPWLLNRFSSFKDRRKASFSFLELVAVFHSDYACAKYALSNPVRQKFSCANRALIFDRDYLKITEIALGTFSRKPVHIYIIRKERTQNKWAGSCEKGPTATSACVEIYAIKVMTCHLNGVNLPTSNDHNSTSRQAFLEIFSLL